MGVLIRSKDWSQTVLGPVSSWSPALRTMIGILLANRFPMLLWWGPESISIYNDAYIPVLGVKHPGALGLPVRECWSEIYDVLRPLIQTPLQGGPSTWSEDLELEIRRHGFLEETHWTVAYSPVPDQTAPHGIGGVLSTVHEITAQVVGERRNLLLRELGLRSSEAKNTQQACATAAAVFARHPRDVPFALIYLIDPAGRSATLASGTGVEKGSPACPAQIDVSKGEGLWPVAKAVRAETAQLVEGPKSRFVGLAGPSRALPVRALVLPIESSLPHQTAGVLVLGLSPLSRVDTSARGFAELATAQLAKTIAHAHAGEVERRQTAALRESEERYAFLLKLSDALRPLADAAEIQATATRTTREVLNADRCTYWEIEGSTVVIQRGASRENLPSLAGSYPFDRHPIFKRVVEAGQPIVVHDAHTTDLLDDDLRRLCVEMRIISVLDVPIVKHGKPSGILCITQCTPRVWTDLEIKLAVDTAERIWAAVERVRAETALRESNERLKKVLEVETLGVIFWDLSTGRMTDANDAFLGLMGYNRQELKAGELTWQRLTPPEYVDASLAEIRNFQSSGRIGPYEKEYLHKDGTRQWFVFAGRSLGGNACVEFCVDISGRKRAEDALRKANHELAETDRRKNEFLAMLSHELRNPLAPISNSVYILDHAPPGGEQSRRAVSVIGRQVTHLTRLIDELLDITRISRGKIRLQRESLALNDVVRSACEDLRDLFRRSGITLEITITDRPLKVFADRTRIAQMVGNLLQNAAKFTPEGGRATLSLEAKGAEAIIEVRDSGAGMDTSLLERLFEPFMQADQTLDRSRGGLGLGLALVKGLVELHGGRVSASSEGLGRGAVFTMRLPLDPQ